jgi:hypothetical protein
MEMALLMAQGLPRNARLQSWEDCAWAHAGRYDGILRLAIALLVIAALVLTLEREGIGWLAEASVHSRA